MFEYLRTAREFNRSAVLFIAVCMLHAFAMHGIYSLLVNLYLLRLGYEASFIGMFNGIANIAIVISPATAALLARRWTPKVPLLSGLLCSIVLIAILPIAEALHGHAQTAWLLVINTLIVLAVSIWFVYGVPFMMSLLEPSQQNHGFSIRWALLAMGGFTGNVTGGWLPPLFASLSDSSTEGPEPFRYALWLAAVLIGIAAIGMKHIHAPQHDDDTSPVNRSEDGGNFIRMLIAFLLIALLLNVATTGTKIFFNVYLETDLGMDSVGIGYIIGSGWLQILYA